MNVEELSFEDKMDRLEEITVEMQDQKVSIKKSVELYEEGMKLIKQLDEELNDAENRVKILSEGKEEDFSGGEDE